MRNESASFTVVGKTFYNVDRPSRINSDYNDQMVSFLPLLFPIWGRRIRFSISKFSSLPLLLYLFLSPSMVSHKYKITKTCILRFELKQAALNKQSNSLERHKKVHEHQTTNANETGKSITNCLFYGSSNVYPAM